MLLDDGFGLRFRLVFFNSLEHIPSLHSSKSVNYRIWSPMGDVAYQAVHHPSSVPQASVPQRGHRINSIVFVKSIVIKFTGAPHFVLLPERKGQGLPHPHLRPRLHLPWVHQSLRVCKDHPQKAC